MSFALLGRAPPNLYSLLFMNIKAWGPQPQVSHMDHGGAKNVGIVKIIKYILKEQIFQGSYPKHQSRIFTLLFFSNEYKKGHSLDNRGYQ